MAAIWAWTMPETVERAADTISFRGWRRYQPAAIPALWRRIADLRLDDDDVGWWNALKAYGPLFTDYDEAAPAARHREPWQRAIVLLADVSYLWRKGEFDIWELPTAPIELSKAHHRLQAELTRVVYDQVRLVVRDLELVPEPLTLEAYLWLSAAASVRAQHRFKRCERCAGWFSLQRTDARFCSASCRSFREAGGSGTASP